MSPAELPASKNWMLREKRASATALRHHRVGKRRARSRNVRVPLVRSCSTFPLRCPAATGSSVFWFCVEHLLLSIALRKRAPAYVKSLERAGDAYTPSSAASLACRQSRARGMTGEVVTREGIRRVTTAGRIGYRHDDSAGSGDGRSSRSPLPLSGEADDDG